MVQCSFLPKKEGMLQLEEVKSQMEELNLKKKLVEPQPLQRENQVTNREN